jgi:hypothetical protein
MSRRSVWEEISLAALAGGMSVAKVAFHEGDFARVLCLELVGDVFQCAVDDFLRHADYEEFG